MKGFIWVQRGKAMLADTPPERAVINTNTMRILILGGTSEASQLAAQLSRNARLQVITSLAGRTEAPAPTAGFVRSGGFGGARGLQVFMEDNAIDVLVDATHVFATQMTRNAIVAARAARRPYYRLCRSAWTPRDGDRWIDADDTAHAAEQLTAGAVAFLTIGRQHLAPFAARRDVVMIARMIEAPTEFLPDHLTIIRGRPPFSLPAEREILRRYRISVIVTKNSGGSAVAAKLTAAREMAIPVIMIRRPQDQPPADASTAEDMAALIERHLTGQ